MINPFTTPAEAKAYVVAKIIEQAAIERVQLSEFERKLLYDSATDEEIDRFEEQNNGRPAEDFWNKVHLLVRHGLRREREAQGRPGQRQYEAALKLAEDQADYLAGIIQIEGLATATLGTQLKHGYRRWLTLAVISVFGGIAFAWILVSPATMTAFDSIERSHAGRFVENVQLYVDRYGGIAFFLAVLSASLYSAVQWVSRKREHR